MFVIQTIKIGEICDEKYNSNNHWESKDRKPKDYDHVLEQTETRFWIDKFHTQYLVFNLPEQELHWIKQAAAIGSFTGTISSIFAEEIQELNKNYKLNAHQEYFVRTEKFSLKTGIHGAGPYQDVKSMIESCITARSGHAPIDADTKSSHVKFYLLPWKTIVQDLEFRVFVYQGKITSISQQNLYQVNQTLSKSNDDAIASILHDIVEYWNNVVSTKITHIDSYVMDIAMVDNSPYFIEINPFGKEYSSGSALFHWIHDGEILYGKKDKIYFRFTI
jgi:hypothetical protein